MRMADYTRGVNREILLVSLGVLIVLLSISSALGYNDVYTGCSTTAPEDLADPTVFGHTADEIEWGGDVCLPSVHITGNLGIGTTSPGYEIDVVGDINARNALCIGGDCRIAWPAGNGTTEMVFRTINAPRGTDPVADSSADTLNLIEGSNIEITGDSNADSIRIDADIDVSLQRTYVEGELSSGTGWTEVCCPADYFQAGVYSYGYYYTVTGWPGGAKSVYGPCETWQGTSNLNRCIQIENLGEAICYYVVNCLRVVVS